MERFRSTSSFAAVVWLGLVGVARAQPDLSGGDIPPPAAQADAVTPPVLRTRADATYPPDALRDRLEGTVGLELEVDERGSVIEARVIAPAGHGFDEAAVAAARAFVFEPARRNGTPIASKVQLAYEFHPPPLTPPRWPPP